MSGWRSPPVNVSKDKEWFWYKTVTSKSNYYKRGASSNSIFEVQEYVGPLGVLIRAVKSYSPGYYRIISTVRPQKEIAFATTRDKMEEMLEILNSEVTPQLVGCSPSQIQSVLPTLIEKLYQKHDIKPLLEDWDVLEDTGFVPTDLSGVIEGLKKDNLEISVTFEYTYTQPPPLELCCYTCNQPALDPHVSPLFVGKIFCASCILFEIEGRVEKFSNQKLSFPAPNLATVLDKLEVYCPFSKFGCGATLPRGELNQHLEECPYVCIICVNRNLGCNFGAKTKAEAIEHMSSCQYSSAICKELTESFSHAYGSSPPLYPTLPSTRLHQHSSSSSSSSSSNHQLALIPTGLPFEAVTERCKICHTDIKMGDESGCTYHPGTWHGLTYEQVQTWKMEVWKQRVSDSLKCVVHYPVQIAKSSSVVGVSVFAFRALLSPTYVLFAGGLLLVLPTWITAPIIATVFSPSKLYKILYKYPYNFLYGDSSKNNNAIVRSTTDPQKWTCCGGLGSSAVPCVTKDFHEYY